MLLSCYAHSVSGDKNNPRADLVIDALLMAIWRRKPEGRILIHSNQGIQYTCGDWNEARAETFNYIEFYYNANRRHGNNGGISPEAYEK